MFGEGKGLILCWEKLVVLMIIKLLLLLVLLAYLML